MTAHFARRGAAPPVGWVATYALLLVFSLLRCSGTSLDAPFAPELCAGADCAAEVAIPDARDTVSFADRLVFADGRDTKPLGEPSDTHGGPADSGEVRPRDVPPDLAPGGWRWPCDDNDECESGYCVEDPGTGETFCTVTCVSDCPEDWDCRIVLYTWPDVTSVCVPPQTRLCEPCAADADCGSPADLCLVIGEVEGAEDSASLFCGRGCGPDGACPPGYGCQDITDDTGAVTNRQCLPDTGSCVCTTEIDGTTRPCERRNEHGACFGFETCDGPRGWTQCTAREPAPELCDGEDNDCNGAKDEGYSWTDRQGAELAIGEACGTGVCAAGRVVCDGPDTATCSGLAQRGEEVCNLLDDDCDGETDEDVRLPFYRDTDGDGQGLAEGLPEWACTAPEGYVDNQLDCDDLDRTVGEGFEERCDGRDNDCDEAIDEDFVLQEGGESLPLGAPCGLGLCVGGIVVCAGDHDTACSTAGYAQAETCDGRDEDCDGETDNTCDDDGDGFCDEDVVYAGIPAVCPQGPGDCDDEDSERHPGAEERCDGVDGDCDGETDEDVVDCAPASCSGGGSDYFAVPAAICEDGACVLPELSGCGLFTCAGGGSEGELCATSCADDTTCVEGAHCDEVSLVCVPDGQPGIPCAEPSDCMTGHCQNGFCCAEGDCCAGPGDCPAAYATPPSCDDPASCQGHRNDAVCEANRCAIGPEIPDDSGCGDEILAVDCSPGVPVYCTGESEQTERACSDRCESDDACLAGFHCDDVCQPDRPDGAPCDEPSDCVSGHCGGGFCCAAGDCCAEARDCPPSYAEAPLCDIPADCQGHRVDPMCKDNVCGSTESLADDTGCTSTVVADDCGPYLPATCSGELEQRPALCPTSCVVDADCDPEAHCDGVCVADLPNGGGCDEDSDCTGGYCNNGFCCGGGVCCGEAEDCPAGFSSAPTCDNRIACQGHRVDAICLGNVCGSSDLVDDDRGCDASVLALGCGPWADVYCTGAENQYEPGCRAGCTGDEDCDDNAHCDGTCLLDQADGAGCDEDSDCTSAHCQNGFCCVEGDCCGVAGDCPEASYTAASVCDDAPSCQGHRVDALCNTYRCEAIEVDDDRGCGGDLVSDDCGLFRAVSCNGGEHQSAPPCPPACDSDADCDPGAHCDGVCVGNNGDGAPCDEASDCLSGHCQNGHCCDAGDCCAVADDCPATYREAPVCHDETSCQGQRIDATCAGNTCGSATVDDDSGCTALFPSDDCGPYLSVSCNGQLVQSRPACPTYCRSDGACDLAAHCDGICAWDLGDGALCNEGSDCESGHCQNGRCCAFGDCCASPADCGGYSAASVCHNTATCQGHRQDALCTDNRCGTTEIPDDRGCTAGTVANDCGYALAVTCTGAANQSAPGCPVVCSGDAQCDPNAHCDGTCQPDLANGSGCNEPSDCASGYCVDGVCCNGSCSAACWACNVPGHGGTCWNNAQPETCNGVDDDCDGTTDEGFDSYTDGWPGNDIGSYPSDNDGDVWESIVPAGEEDWMAISAVEDDNVWCSDINCRVRLTNIPDGRDYDLCVCWTSIGATAPCDITGWSCSVAGSNTSEEVTVSLPEEGCVLGFGNGDDEQGYCEIRVYPYTGSSCDDYHIQWEIWE